MTSVASKEVLKLEGQQEVVEQRALSLPDQARALKIVTPEAFAQADEFLGNVAALRKEVDQTFDPDIERWHLGHKAALATKRRIEAPLADAEAIIKQGMIVYRREEARLLAERQAAAQYHADVVAAVLRTAVGISAAADIILEEEARLIAAEGATAAGDTEAAERILADSPTPENFNAPIATTVFVPPVERLAPVKARFATFKQVYDFEIVNDDAIPSEYKVTDLTKIRGVVRSLGPKANIAGIRVFPVDQAAKKAG